MKHLQVNESIGITACGMITPLGFDFDTSCAASRAGISRLTKLKVMDFLGEDLWGDEPVSGHAVPNITHGFVGISKAMLLGEYALKDLLKKINRMNIDHARTGIAINVTDQFLRDTFILGEITEEEEFLKHLATDNDENRGDEEYFEPEVREQQAEELPSKQWKHQCKNLIPSLLEACDLSIPVENQQLIFGHHAEIVKAIDFGVEMIKKGILDHCIIGGIDCCIEPGFLEAAASLRTLNTGANPVGYFPGEAAGFFILEKINSRLVEKKPAFVNLIGYSTDIEEVNRFSGQATHGLILANTINTLISDVINNEPNKIGLVISDLNGDEYRAKEWGHALLHLQKHRLDGLPEWLPAMSFGETGAASGVLTIGMALRGVQRSYAPNGLILIWLSSDNGAKSAICLKQMK